MKTIKFLTIGIISVLISCNSQNNNTQLKLEDKNYSKLNEKVTLVDTMLNPFTKSLIFKKDECKSTNYKDRFNCILNTFPNQNLPLHFGPHPEIESTPYISDTAFVENSLLDKDYFKNEDFTHGYYKGVIIANNLKIKTVIIPTIYNVGKDYTLYTFTDDGKLIDKLIIGAESSDYESKFGVIESFDKIKITTKIIGYKSNSKLYFYSSSKTEYFKVSQSGKILKK